MGSLANQNNHTVFAGPTSGGPAVPSFRLLDPTDIPALPYLPSSAAFYYQTVAQDGTAQTQEPKLNLISGVNITVSCVDNPGVSTDCTIASTANLGPNPNVPSISFQGGAAGSLVAGSNDGAGSVDVTTGNASGGNLFKLTFGGTYTNPMFCVLDQLAFPAWAAGVYPSNPGSTTVLQAYSTISVPSGTGFVNYQCHQ
jgi:hypothetical protein